MIEIQFHPIAIEDIKDLYVYFSKYSLQYADSFVDGLFNHIENLKRFPEMGKKYPENETYRQIIHQNYRILYKYIREEDQIIIMIVVHCSRQLRL